MQRVLILAWVLVLNTQIACVTSDKKLTTSILDDIRDTLIALNSDSFIRRRKAYQTVLELGKVGRIILGWHLVWCFYHKPFVLLPGGRLDWGPGEEETQPFVIRMHGISNEEAWLFMQATGCELYDAASISAAMRRGETPNNVRRALEQGLVENPFVTVHEYADSPWVPPGWTTDLKKFLQFVGCDLQEQSEVAWRLAALADALCPSHWEYWRKNDEKRLEPMYDQIAPVAVRAMKNTDSRRPVELQIPKACQRNLSNPGDIISLLQRLQSGTPSAVMPAAVVLTQHGSSGRRLLQLHLFAKMWRRKRVMLYDHKPRYKWRFSPFACIQKPVTNEELLLFCLATSNPIPPRLREALKNPAEHAALLSAPVQDTPLELLWKFAAWLNMHLPNRCQQQVIHDQLKVPAKQALLHFVVFG